MITIVRMDDTLLPQAMAIRLQCMREVAGMAAGEPFSHVFLTETEEYLRHGDHVTLLAMDGNVPVGCATLCFLRCIPTTGHPTGRRAHLMNVYVAPAYRRQGLARRIVLLLHQEAAARGVTEISLDATLQGRYLYEALGYEASDEAMTFDIGR